MDELKEAREPARPQRFLQRARAFLGKAASYREAWSVFKEKDAILLEEELANLLDDAYLEGRRVERAPKLQQDDGLLESLAQCAHELWAQWMTYLFSKCQEGYENGAIIPPELVERWHRQRQTPYSALPAEEQQSDREQARHVLGILEAGGWLAEKTELEESAAILRRRVQVLRELAEDWADDCPASLIAWADAYEKGLRRALGVLEGRE